MVSQDSVVLDASTDGRVVTWRERIAEDEPLVHDLLSAALVLALTVLLLAGSSGAAPSSSGRTVATVAALQV